MFPTLYTSFIFAMINLTVSRRQPDILRHMSYKTSHCVCRAIYRPVCDINGNMYSNSCKAECNKAVVMCELPCPCPANDLVSAPIQCNQRCESKEMIPVCGYDNVSYPSSCHSSCAGMRVRCLGHCPCGVLGTFDPKNDIRYCKCSVHENNVCGMNGETYTNECFASCKKVRLQCRKRCPCS